MSRLVRDLEILREALAEHESAGVTNAHTITELAKEVRQLTAALAERDQRIAELTADTERLNQMIREHGYGQGAIDTYVAQCEELERAKERIAELERERDELQSLYRDSSIKLMGDEERRAIQRLINEHGVLDEDCWTYLVQERDQLRTDLDKHMELVRTMGERCDKLAGMLRRTRPKPNDCVHEWEISKRDWDLGGDREEVICSICGVLGERNIQTREVCWPAT